MISWLSAYLLTVALEMPIWAWGLRRTFPSGWALVGIAFGTSLVTHPILWLAYNPTGSPDSGLLVAEASVACVEGLLVWALSIREATRGLSLPRALLISIAANGTSALTGMLLSAL